MKAEQTRCPQEAGPVWDGEGLGATGPATRCSNARPSVCSRWRLGEQMRGGATCVDEAEGGFRQRGRCGPAAGSYSGRTEIASEPSSRRLQMTVASYAFDETDAVTAAGVALRIPAGLHQVERRSLVFRVRIGGREVALPLAEFERLRSAGRVKAAADPASKESLPSGRATP